MEFPCNLEQCFPSLSNIDILDLTIPWCGGGSMLDRMWSSILDHYQLMPIEPPLESWQSKMFPDFAKCSLGVGEQNHPCLRTLEFMLFIGSLKIEIVHHILGVRAIFQYRMKWNYALQLPMFDLVTRAEWQIESLQTRDWEDSQESVLIMIHL